MSKQPEHISGPLNRLFGGFKPDQVTLTMVRQYRRQYLPQIGHCQAHPEIISGLGLKQLEGCLSIPAYTEICRQINEQDLVPDKVCQQCTYHQCAIKKGMALPT